MKFSLIASAALLGVATAGEAYVYDTYHTAACEGGYEVCHTQWCSEHAYNPVPTHYAAPYHKKEVKTKKIIAWYTKTIIDHSKTATKWKTETEWCTYTIPAKTVTDTHVIKVTKTKTLEECKTVVATVTETKTVKGSYGGYGGYGSKEKRGDYGYEAPLPHYPKDVICTKVIEDIYTKTVKVPQCKATITECEHTATKTKYVKETKTVYPAHATVTVWKDVTSTYYATVIHYSTKTNTVTKYATVTSYHA